MLLYALILLGCRTAPALPGAGGAGTAGTAAAPPAEAPPTPPWNTRLPANGATQLGGAPLPPGRRRPISTVWRDKEVWVWVSDQPLSQPLEQWRSLREARLWPLLVPLPDRTELQAHLDGVFHPDPDRKPGERDAEQVLRHAWADFFGDEEHDPALQPFSASFPGLAPGAKRDAEPSATPASEPEIRRAFDPALGSWFAAHLVLVDARSGSEALAALGWVGAPGVDGLRAVLASWEDRFGVEVCGVSGDALLLTVAHPPENPRDNLRLAAERVAVCPELLEASGEMLTLVAEQQAGATVWRMRWG